MPFAMAPQHRNAFRYPRHATSYDHLSRAPGYAARRAQHAHSACSDCRLRALAQEAAAEKRKANADLWLAVAPTTAPKKARGPPKDRSLS